MLNSNLDVYAVFKPKLHQRSTPNWRRFRYHSSQRDRAMLCQSTSC